MEEQNLKEQALHKALYILVKGVNLDPHDVSTLRLTDLHLAGKAPTINIDKGTSVKSFDLDLDAHRALVGWLVARPDSANDFLFPGPGPEPMPANAIERAVKLFEQTHPELKISQADVPASKPSSPEPGQKVADVPLDSAPSDETIVSSRPPGPLPARPAPATPPPFQPESGLPPRPPQPFSTPPPTRPPERGAPIVGPGARPFPAQPFPPTPGQSPEQTTQPGDAGQFPPSAATPGRRTPPQPVRESKPRVPPKPVARRGVTPVPVNMPGKDSEQQPPTPVGKESLPPEQAQTESGQPSPVRAQPAQPVPPVSRQTGTPAQMAEKEAGVPQIQSKPVAAPPGIRQTPVHPSKREPTMPPPPPIPNEGVSRPAIFSFATGGGIVLLALCIICVGGVGWFAYQGDTGALLAEFGPGAGDEQATSIAATEMAIVEATLAAAAITPSPTATLPPTSTPTPLPATDTPVPTATPTPEPTPPPTDTPLPTDTPAPPTDTPVPPPTAPPATPTPVESPTPETPPTPAMKYGAPVILEPKNGFPFIGGNTIVLRWQPVDLAADEQYAVRMVYQFNGQPTWAGANLKEPEWTIPLSLFGKIDPPENKYEWFVVIERLNEDGSGTAISPESEHRTFTWK